MKRLFSVIAALLVCWASYSQYRTPYSELYEGDASGRMRLDVAAIAAASEEGAAKHIAGRFREAGVDLLSEEDVFGIRQDGGDTLRSRNVTAFIPGYDPELRERYIVIGTRMGSGATAGATGPAVLLELARKLRQGSVLLRRTVILASFGASGQDNAGAWYFVNRSFPSPDKIDVMVDLELLGTMSSGFFAFTASNADLDLALKSFSATLQPVQPQLSSREMINGAHRAFYAAQIPSVLFTTVPNPPASFRSAGGDDTEYGNMERICEYLYNFTVSLAGGPAPSFLPSEVPVRESSADAVPWSECDVRPAFLGSTDVSVFLRKWVYTYLKYPTYALENGIQGRVLVDFVIDEKGKVGEVKVLRGVHPALDDEAVRVISASPDWRPAKVRGKKVKCEMSLYVEFRLERKKKK